MSQGSTIAFKRLSIGFQLVEEQSRFSRRSLLQLLNSAALSFLLFLALAFLLVGHVILQVQLALNALLVRLV
jgi:hypothetical protein